MNPIDAIRFVHTAITVEADSLEHACVGAAADDLPGLGERVAMLARVVNGHTHAEEQSIFPALEERAPHVAATYLFDHVDERELFVSFARAIEAGSVPEVHRHGVALREHLTTHIRKENELVIPLVAKLFTVPEQVGLIQKLLGAIPPAEMLVAAGWMASKLSHDERVAWLEGVSRSAPAAALTPLARSVRGALDAEAWSELAGRVPAIATAAG